MHVLRMLLLTTTAEAKLTCTAILYGKAWLVKRTQKTSLQLSNVPGLRRQEVMPPAVVCLPAGGYAGYSEEMCIMRPVLQ
jgi:hypothetical protein